jgi:hypothetical protein
MDAGSGTPRALQRRWRPLFTGLQNHTTANETGIEKIKIPSSPRLISTSLLRVSPLFQIWPINLVVYQESYSL